jgi:hypothetical protein
MPKTLRMISVSPNVLTSKTFQKAEARRDCGVAEETWAPFYPPRPRDSIDTYGPPLRIQGACEHTVLKRYLIIYIL